jgi:hypothetical protein
MVDEDGDAYTFGAAIVTGAVTSGGTTLTGAINQGDESVVLHGRVFS